MATTMEVGDSFNILGATVFWLYIAAALYFTYQTITTIVNIKPAQDEKDDRRKEDVVIFSSLATISFGTLSKNMLDVLIHSYRIWSERHGLTASLSPAQVWRWSITSTLFQDFGEALVATQERYLWVQSALFVTMSVCIFMALAGESSIGRPRQHACMLMRNTQAINGRSPSCGRSSASAKSSRSASR